MPKVSFVYCPFPNKKSAEKIATTLLKEKLIACANIIEGGTSVYRWKGKVEKQKEVYVIFKTSLSSEKKLRSRLLQLHSYGTACVVSLKLSAVNSDFEKWVLGEIKKSGAL